MGALNIRIVLYITYATKERTDYVIEVSDDLFKEEAVPAHDRIVGRSCLS